MNHILDHSRNKVAVFDSGLGGLTVLKELLKLCPNEHYIYFSDHLNNPYGVKTSSLVYDFVQRAVSFLVSKKIKMLVIACNTATSICIADLRRKYKIPIIGLEPAIKVPVSNDINSKVLVLATSSTIKGRGLKRLEHQFYKNKKNLTKISADKLVIFAENLRFDDKAVQDYLNELFASINLNEYSNLVLGCTHFIYFKKILRRILKDYKIALVDGNKSTALHARNVLISSQLICTQPQQRTIEYYQTKGEKLTEEHHLKVLQALQYLEKN